MSQLKSFVQKTPILNFFYNLIKRTYILIIHLIVFVLVAVFILVNYKIFKNRKIYLFWTWSFGHQVLSYDWMSRHFHPEKISLIFIPHPRNNLHLTDCFNHSFNAFTLRSTFFTNSHRNGEIAKKIFKNVLKIICIFKKDVTIYDDIPQIYESLSKNYTKKFKVFSYEKNAMVPHINNIGYYDLLNNNVGKSPKLSKKIRDYVEKKILIQYPKFLEKKFVFLLLRSNRSNEHFDFHRRNGSLDNYFKAVKYLCSSNYVVIAQDNKFKYFDNLDHSLNFSKIRCDQDLLNLYLLTQCSLLVTQQSGAHILANSIGVPVIICDAYPLYLGTFNSNDVILFKKITFNNKILSLDEIILRHSDIIYGKIFNDSEYKIQFNSEDEILNAVQRRKIRKYNFPDNTPIHYTNNFIVETN